MLVSKSNELNTSAFFASRNYNGNNSSNPMELLAHSIIKLICKEAASATYCGALETLQKMMSECIYQEGNAFVIMGAGEQLKRIKYDVDENNLKVFNVHFDNNEVLVTDGEPDVVCLSKQVWENLLIKLKPEIKENVFSENNKLSRENNVDQYVQSAKRNEQALFDNIIKVIFMLLHFSCRTRSVISETPPNDCMEARNSYENQIDEISSLSESKEHPIDIQEKTDAFVNEFRGYYLIKMEGLQSFYLIFMNVAMCFYQERSLRIKLKAIIQHCKLFPSFVHLR